MLHFFLKTCLMFLDIWVESFRYEMHNSCKKILELSAYYNFF